MKLYHHPTSAACHAILLFAANEGVALAREFVDLDAGAHHAPRFTALNPNRAVPVLEDGPFCLTDPAAILKYLAVTVRSPAYPAGNAARARVDLLLDRLGAAFGEEPSPFGLPDRGWARRIDHQTLDLLERCWLGESGGDLLGGATPCLADYLGACLVADACGAVHLARRPRIRRWLAEMRTLPGWAEAQPWQVAARGARLAPAA